MCVIFRCSQDEIMNHVESCRNHLDYFASATSNFTHCAIRHARPITVCESCVGYYLDVLKAHEDILKV